MISVDTNIVIRLFVDTEPKQTLAAEKLFDSQEKIAIADIAIIETIYVLTQYYSKNREAASECIVSLLDNPKVNCNRPLFRKTLNLYQEHPSLSIEDCYLVVCAELNDATPLMTFDKKLARQTQHSELLD